MEGTNPIVQKRKCSEEFKKLENDQTKKPKTFAEGNDPKNPIKIYCYDSFDLIHYCHGRFLEQCKKQFQYCTLIVGVTSDEDGIKYDKRTVMTEFERTETLRNYKYVDEIICPCPWIPTVVLNFLMNRAF